MARRKEIETQVETQVEEVKYIKCEIMKADLDTKAGTVTLTVQDIAYQTDMGCWFVEDYKPTFYEVFLDMSNDNHRQLLFDRLITYCFNCAKFSKIADKIEKGLIGYTWKFSSKMLNKVA